MAITVCPVTQSFAAEIGDVDLAKPLAPDDLAAIKHAFADLRGADLSRAAAQPGPASRLRASVRPARDHHRGVSQGRQAAPAAAAVRRLQPQPRQRDVGERSTASACSRWATGCGTPTARSSGCRRAPPCSTRARSRRSAATPSSPTSAPPTTRCPRRPSAGSTGLVAEHSIFTSRARLGFTNFSDEERQSMPPVPQVLVRTHSRSRPQVALPRLACRAACSACPTPRAAR